MVRRRRLIYAALALGLAAQTQVAALAADLSNGGTVLLLGDSILDTHRGDRRVEAVMQRLLERKTPQARWTIYNEAHGGEYIGPKEGNPAGVSEPLFTTETTGRYFEIVRRHPKVDAVIANYAANDSKVYPPAGFRQRLEALAALLEKQYPGTVFIFSTSMYLDPAHSGPYTYDDPKVPGFRNGNSRDAYLEPYNEEIRKFTASHGYRLADIYRRVAAETARGDWDLRERAGGDPRDDPKHANDMAWFDNIHPNDRGTGVIAGLYIETLLEALAAGDVDGRRAKAAARLLEFPKREPRSSGWFLR